MKINEMKVTKDDEITRKMDFTLRRIYLQIKDGKIDPNQMLSGIMRYAGDIKSLEKKYNGFEITSMAGNIATFNCRARDLGAITKEKEIMAIEAPKPMTIKQPR